MPQAASKGDPPRPRWIPGTLVLLAGLLLALRLITGRNEEYGILGEISGLHAILLVHGLDEPGVLWKDTRRTVADLGWPVYEFVYPNDQGISDSAQLLAEELRASRFEEVALVAHSMGCIVIRDLLSEPERPEIALPETLRIRGAVLIAPPNHGSRLARFRAGLELREQLQRVGDPELKLVDPWRTGSGRAGEDLAPASRFLGQLNTRHWPATVPAKLIVGYDSPVDFLDPEERRQVFEEHLASGQLPEFPFPELLDGYGDGSVAVQSALHPDFTDVAFVDGIHRPLVDLPQTREIVDSTLRQWLGP